MRHIAALGVVLAGVWLLWSGHFDGLMLTFGAVSCVTVLLIVQRMGIVDREAAPIHLLLRSMLYLPWLSLEIVKANLHVARRILSPALPIEPSMIEVKAGQHEDLVRVIYANSITLTPGTVSVHVEGNRITVHALTRESAEGLQSGEMDRRVSRIEGGR